MYIGTLVHFRKVLSFLFNFHFLHFFLCRRHPGQHVRRDPDKRVRRHPRRRQREGEQEAPAYAGGGQEDQGGETEGEGTELQGQGHFPRAAAAAAEATAATNGGSWEGAAATASSAHQGRARRCSLYYTTIFNIWESGTNNP